MICKEFLDLMLNLIFLGNVLKMKKNSWNYRVMYGVIFTLLGMTSLGLHAQPASYPNKPVKLLIPFLLL